MMVTSMWRISRDFLAWTPSVHAERDRQRNHLSGTPDDPEERSVGVT
jgi:hypothetical protein